MYFHTSLSNTPEDNQIQKKNPEFKMEDLQLIKNLQSKYGAINRQSVPYRVMPECYLQFRHL